MKVIILLAILGIAICNQDEGSTWITSPSGKQYHDTGRWVNFIQARVICRDMGANLPRFESLADQTWVHENVSKARKNAHSFWLEAYYMQTRTLIGWYWGIGTPELTYTAWGNREPRHEYSFKCLAIRHSNSNTWESQYCEQFGAVICQK